MAKRNLNGQGSIIQRKTGLWMGAITLENQRKFIYGKSFKTNFRKGIFRRFK